MEEENTCSCGVACEACSGVEGATCSCAEECTCEKCSGAKVGATDDMTEEAPVAEV